MKEAERNVTGCEGMHAQITCLPPPSWEQEEFERSDLNFEKNLKEWYRIML